MYQANAALPPLIPQVHFKQDQVVSNPFALNTKIMQSQEKASFSHDGRFNTSTNVFNENGRFAEFIETIHGNKVNRMCIFPNNKIYMKLEDKRDNIDQRMFCVDKISDVELIYGRHYRTMIVTYKKDEGLRIGADSDEYQIPCLYQSKFLNYDSSVIKDNSYANGHFKENNKTANNTYTYNLKDFDMIKAVSDERAQVGLIDKKELAIYLAMNYIASTNVQVEVGDGGLSIDHIFKFSRIVNPKWATDMYTTYGQDVTVKDYLKPHFMDGYIRKEDSVYITTGYLQHVKNDAWSGNNLSDEDAWDEEDGTPLTEWYYQVPPLTEGDITKLHHGDNIQLFLIDRQIKQFVNIITLNALHHTNFDHAYVFSVHFSKSAIESDVTAASAKWQRVQQVCGGFLGR